MEAPPVLVDRSIAKFLVLSVLATATTGGCLARKADQPDFTAGREALKRGEYELAIEKLEIYLRNSPTGRLASRSSFLIAKALLGLGDLEQSRKRFELTIREFPTSEEAHKSRYKLAMLSFLDEDDDDAYRRFTELAEKPSGTLAAEATAMMRYLDRVFAAKTAGNG